MLKMVGIFALVCVAAASAMAYAYGFLPGSSTLTTKEKSVYEFSMKDIDGNNVKLKAYKGQVAMVVNTASKCGYTPQYEGLQALYDKYKAKGFVVLGFPANNFNGQEPGTEKEIKEFCTLKYHVTFPMFSKISVKGADQDPFYTFLTGETTDPGFSGDITWNFEKFIVDRSGKVIARFSPKTTPEDPKVIEAIETAIAKDKGKS